MEDVFAAAGLELLRVAVKRGYQHQELTALIEKVLPSISAEDALVSVETSAAAMQPQIDAVTTNGHHSAVENHNQERKVVLSTPLCPKCGNEMVLRTAKKGDNQGQKFWGCPNYPRCRTVVAYEPMDV